MNQNLSPRIGVGVIVLNRGDQILLGKRINSHGAESWGPPGGGLELGESFEECAIREMQEETGVVIEAPKFLALTNDYFEQDNKHYISVFMKIKMPINQSIQNLEPDKIESWQWFDLSNLPDNLFLPLKNLINGLSYGGSLLQTKISIY